MRLFVSVDLPKDLAPAVEAIQDDLRPASGLDLTDPEQAHITMTFLGDVSRGRLEDVDAAIGRAVEDADVAPFEATFEGLGAFPSTEYIRVVWLGVGEGSESFGRLHEALEAQMTAMGFDPEEHEFTPHVTLGRMNHAGGKELVQRILREDVNQVGRMRVEEVRLTESELSQAGPEYSTVAKFPLAD